jgi:formyltetrahydrofolate-dependent phosphoribosylglycinamide formyltransferase
MSVSVAVFASGSGSNFQSLLDHESPASPGRIRLLISDRPGAGALDRAGKGSVPSRVIAVSGRSPEDVGLETLSTLREAKIQVVVLAGYLRLIPPAVIRAFPRRILNIHPALLPSFGGKGMWGHHVHEAVLASGASFSGPTIHFVDEEFDTGTILAQWPVPVLAGDTPEELAARVLRVEHILYPLAADHLCRAVATDKTPARLSPPGEAFQIARTFDTSAVAEQISAAFSSTL